MGLRLSVENAGLENWLLQGVKSSGPPGGTEKAVEKMGRWRNRNRKAAESP